MTSDEERMALLAGRPSTRSTRTSGRRSTAWTALLADPATWAEPAPDLEDLVVASSPGPPGAEPGAGRLDRPHVRFVGAPAAGRSGRRRRDRGRGHLLSAAATPTGPSASPGTLAGTELAPGRHRQVAIFEDSAGFRVELKANDLPPLDGGRFYQAWLRGPAGQHPHRHVQRGRRELGDPVGGRLAEGLPGAHGDHRGAGRQSGVVRSAGASARPAPDESAGGDVQHDQQQRGEDVVPEDGRRSQRRSCDRRTIERT